MKYQGDWRVNEADYCIKRTAGPQERALEEEKSNSFCRQKDHYGPIRGSVTNSDNELLFI